MPSAVIGAFKRARNWPAHDPLHSRGTPVIHLPKRARGQVGGQWRPTSAAWAVNDRWPEAGACAICPISLEFTN